VIVLFLSCHGCEGRWGCAGSLDQRTQFPFQFFLLRPITQPKDSSQFFVIFDEFQMHTDSVRTIRPSANTTNQSARWRWHMNVIAPATSVQTVVRTPSTRSCSCFFRLKKVCPSFFLLTNCKTQLRYTADGDHNLQEIGITTASPLTRRVSKFFFGGLRKWPHSEVRSSPRRHAQSLGLKGPPPDAPAVF
jgi:hypothetical protein